MNGIRLWVKDLVYRMRGEVITERLIKDGMKVGKNFSRQNNVILDPGHCWLIDIGDNVTLAPRVTVLCHDASTVKSLGYAKIGKVTIGNNVFVGAGALILPGVRIGNDVIVGANSTVTKSIPDGTVVAGTPAKAICTMQEYKKKMQQAFDSGLKYEEEYTVRGGIDSSKKAKMVSEMADETIAFVR